MTDLNTSYNKFQELINSNEVNLSTFKTIGDAAVKIHGEFKSRLCQYLSPKGFEFCSKLIHAIPITLVISTLSLPQTVVVSAIGGACLWSCKKQFLDKDSKISLLHSMAIAFFSNIVTSTISLGLIFRLPINAALLAGSLLLADRIEAKAKKEAENETKPNTSIELAEPTDTMESSELIESPELTESLVNNLLNSLSGKRG